MGAYDEGICVRQRMGVQRMGCNAWGHVSDVTLYTASQRLLRASL